MNFISWTFVGLIVPVLLARLTIGRSRRGPVFTAVLLVAGTTFVCWYVPAAILVMLVSIGVDYVAALGIAAAQTASRRRLYLAASLSTNLLLLGFFKYANFFLGLGDQALGWVHAAPPPRHHLNVLLPIGISFYTFGSMSYTIDVYRGLMPPVRRFRDFYYFLTFFPHMVAGPIIRAEQFFYQVGRRRRPSVRVWNEGGYQVLRGLFLKMVLADHLATAVNDHWAAGYEPAAGSGQSLLLATMFAGQIYCDFEGYTSIARGLAYWLGYRFPVNFDNPYLAGTFSNFWERWHITLSRWLRDYFYISLGGNRGPPWRTYLNLMLVMTIGGLWHGPAMTFVIWGFLHGAALAVERVAGLNRPAGRPAWARVGWYAVVQAVVLLAWVCFRSDTVRHAATFAGHVVRWHRGPIDGSVWRGAICLLPVVASHGFGKLVEVGRVRPLGRLAQAVLAAGLLLTVLTCYGTSNEFIYFQF